MWKSYGRKTPPKAEEWSWPTHSVSIYSFFWDSFPPSLNLWARSSKFYLVKKPKFNCGQQGARLVVFISCQSQQQLQESAKENITFGVQLYWWTNIWKGRLCPMRHLAHQVWEGPLRQLPDPSLILKQYSSTYHTVESFFCHWICRDGMSLVIVLRNILYFHWTYTENICNSHIRKTSCVWACWISTIWKIQVKYF